jgi:hypothetical protein
VGSKRKARLPHFYVVPSPNQKVGYYIVLGELEASTTDLLLGHTKLSFSSEARI